MAFACLDLSSTTMKEEWVADSSVNAELSDTQRNAHSQIKMSFSV